MPRYHFNVHDGRSKIDTEGTELVNFEQAQREAVRFAGLILAHEVDRLLAGEDWGMEVTDETGQILYRLDVSMQQTAAIAGLA